MDEWKIWMNGSTDCVEKERNKNKNPKVVENKYFPNLCLPIGEGLG